MNRPGRRSPRPRLDRRVDSGCRFAAVRMTNQQRSTADGQEGESKLATSASTQGTYSPSIVAALADVSTSVIRRWQRRGFLVPIRIERRLPYFDYLAVVRARRLAGWLSSCAQPLAVERALANWLRQRGVPATILDEVELRVEGSHVLLRLAGQWLDAGGQQWLEFDRTPPIAESSAGVGRPAVLPWPGGAGASRAVSPPSTEELLEWAAEFEERSDWARAAEVYRAALAAGGPRADICFQLAEALYRQGDLSAARERYYVALEIDEDFVEARANLGCVLAELGETDLAIAALHGALDLAPDFPDVHYHLARLLDDAGQSAEALTHWERFLELAPHSPWAELARQRVASTGLK